MLQVPANAAGSPVGREYCSVCMEAVPCPAAGAMEACGPRFCCATFHIQERTWPIRWVWQLASIRAGAWCNLEKA